MDILKKLTPKLAAIVLCFSVILLAAVLCLAVVRGSAISLFGIEIASSIPKQMRMYISFSEPVNAIDPSIRVNGYMRLSEHSLKRLEIVRGNEVGGMFVDLNVGEETNPIFFEIVDNGKKWVTEDYSSSFAHLTAYRIH